MTWTKLSDDDSDDCWSLSDAAYRLHHEGLVWSNRKLLDCRIPKDDIRRLSRSGDAVVAGELVAKGFWSEDIDHYVIRHHARYQRTREEVIRQQEANKRNGQRGGRPRKEPREIVEPGTGNPVGLRTANPVVNPEGRDRTGLDREEPETDSTNEDDDRTAEYLETYREELAADSGGQLVHFPLSS